MAVSNRLTNLELPTGGRGSFWTSRTLSRRSTNSTPPNSLPITNPRRSSTLATLSRDTPSTYVQQKIKAYNLPWPRLRLWLIRRFSNEQGFEATLIKNQEGIRDDFYFRTPQELTKEDIDKINNLRDKNNVKTDRAIHGRYTPDPDPDCDDDDV